ncbi:MAG: hypothetical protein RhofKO_29270 [Rhodothermales bacterium]
MDHMTEVLEPEALTAEPEAASSETVSETEISKAQGDTLPAEEVEVAEAATAEGATADGATAEDTPTEPEADAAPKEPRYLPGTVGVRQWHEFTDEEAIRAANALSDAMVKLTDIEAEESSVKKEFKAKKELANADIEKLHRQYREGGEERNIVCRVRLDDETSERVYESAQTGDEIKRAAFEHGDDQLGLDLEENKQRELEAAFRQGEVDFDKGKTTNPFDEDEEPAVHGQWQAGWEAAEAKLTIDPSADDEVAGNEATDDEAASDESDSVDLADIDTDDIEAVLEHMHDLKSALETDILDAHDQRTSDLYDRAANLRAAAIGFQERKRRDLTKAQSSDLEILKSDLVRLMGMTKPKA